MEDVFQRGPLIAQCCLYGVNRPHTILLVVPNYAELRRVSIVYTILCCATLYDAMLCVHSMPSTTSWNH